jgi:phage-related protein (TIGR01555 family)
MARKKSTAVTVSNAAEGEVIQNNLGGLVASLFPYAGGQFGAQVSQTDTMFVNNRWYLLSNNRNLLSQMYVEHGIVQTLVDQPVDDAFSPGFVVKSGQLAPSEVEELLLFAESIGAIENLKTAINWKRLYGGAALLLITEQDPVTKFEMKQLKPDSRIEFRAVDMWELYYNQSSLAENPTVVDGLDFNEEFFNYYGKRIHRSRVLIQKGKIAPSFIRPRLRGWGMSELERLVRSFNQYLKNQDVIFELLDEAKIDVYKIDGFNNLLLTGNGTEQVLKRLHAANMIKNFSNAITMDTKDEYEQKNLPFTGLGEILVQIRQGIAADLKMPMTKLFGISAAGFNSGEDDIENYNSMLESQIRTKCKPALMEVLKICCQLKFGFIPDDMKVEWNSLRILSGEEEEKVKNHQFNRTLATYKEGLMSVREAKEAINIGGLLPLEIEENDEALPPVDGGGDIVGEGDGDNVKSPESRSE